MYWIKRRRLWGDYGAVLLHGEARYPSVDDDLPDGTVILSLCAPHDSVLLPTGFFLCTRDVAELLKTLEGVRTIPVWIEQCVEVPIERWLKRGHPKYPRGGEPEGYFERYDAVAGFEPGFSNDIVQIVPDAIVPVYVPDFTTANPQPIPEIRGDGAIGCQLVQGKQYEHSTYGGPLFCSEGFAECLRKAESMNFELIPLDT